MHNAAPKPVAAATKHMVGVTDPIPEHQYTIAYELCRANIGDACLDSTVLCQCRFSETKQAFGSAIWYVLSRAGDTCLYNKASGTEGLG